MGSLTRNGAATCIFRSKIVSFSEHGLNIIADDPENVLQPRYVDIFY